MIKARLVVLVGAVREVEARDVHARPKHLAQDGHPAETEKGEGRLEGRLATRRRLGRRMRGGADARRAGRAGQRRRCEGARSLAACRAQGADDLRGGARRAGAAACIWAAGAVGGARAGARPTAAGHRATASFVCGQPSRSATRPQACKRLCAEHGRACARTFVLLSGCGALDRIASTPTLSLPPSLMLASWWLCATSRLVRLSLQAALRVPAVEVAVSDAHSSDAQCRQRGTP